jgi:hypothetical protein
VAACGLSITCVVLVAPLIYVASQAGPADEAAKKEQQRRDDYKKENGFFRIEK